jgi:hypothetical protein
MLGAGFRNDSGYAISEFALKVYSRLKSGFEERSLLRAFSNPPCKGSRQFPEEERQETKRAAHRARQSQASNEDGLGIDEKSRHRVECVLARQPRVLST